MSRDLETVLHEDKLSLSQFSKTVGLIEPDSKVLERAGGNGLHDDVVSLIGEELEEDKGEQSEQAHEC